MNLEIVTPVRKLHDVEASEVVLPGAVGEFGVLPGHKPFLASLGTGVMTYRSGGQLHALMISGGLCEVLEDRIAVLAEYAQPATEIDIERARRKIGELEGTLARLQAGDEQAPDLNARLEKHRARISAAVFK
ncbi:MAG: ATP synthase F1 subunit epsilon [Pseudomonadota bacterium]